MRIFSLCKDPQPTRRDASCGKSNYRRAAPRPLQTRSVGRSGGKRLLISGRRVQKSVTRPRRRPDGLELAWRECANKPCRNGWPGVPDTQFSPANCHCSCKTSCLKKCWVSSRLAVSVRLVIRPLIALRQSTQTRSKISNRCLHVRSEFAQRASGKR